MATWKYGPIVVNDDPGGYSPVEDDSYEVHYHTVSDFLSVFRNGKREISWAYFGSRAVAKMITKWYLTDECNHDSEFIDSLLERKNDKR